MNVSLTHELETVIEEKVKSGLYNDASEVVRDALRRAFCQPLSLNLDEDTPELAALIREGRNSGHTPHRKGDVRKLLDRFRVESGVLSAERLLEGHSRLAGPQTYGDAMGRQAWEGGSALANLVFMSHGAGLSGRPPARA